MKRREFLLGGGAIFLAGCAGGGQRDWADVPWVAEGPPAAPPMPRPSFVATAPPTPAPQPLARPSAKPSPCGPCAAPPPMPSGLRAPVRSGSGWQLVRREEWGAACLRANHDPMGTITRITLHHTDEHPGMRGKADADVVRGIQRYHQESQGWADIGYHYLVGTDGRIYEGRAVSVQGAHSGGANNVGNLGISVIGNFSDHMPSRRQMEALGAFLDDRRAALHLPSHALYGHRDLGKTECPGSALYGWLQQFKRA